MRSYGVLSSLTGPMIGALGSQRAASCSGVWAFASSVTLREFAIEDALELGADGLGLSTFMLIYVSPAREGRAEGRLYPWAPPFTRHAQAGCRAGMRASPRAPRSRRCGGRRGRAGHRDFALPVA
jgi:hypothetical protein